MRKYRLDVYSRSTCIYSQITMAKQFVFSFLIVSALFFNIQGQTPRRGTVRFVRNGLTSSSYTSGRVQIYLTSWGHICDDADFAFTEANVICHQQGYTGAASNSRASFDSFGLDTQYPITLDNVNCSTSNYLTILQCHYSTIISSSCVHGSDDVSVSCYSTRIWNSPYDGQIRLQDAQLTNQGLVEVYCNGQWGTVCEHDFDQVDANTVCRQLGYTGAAAYDTLSFRGSLSQPIWLADVFCAQSNYLCLRSCQMCPSEAIRNCGHTEDVTIECEYVSGSSSDTMISTCNIGTSSSTSGTSNPTSTTHTAGTTHSTSDPPSAATTHSTNTTAFTTLFTGSTFTTSTVNTSGVAIIGIVVAVILCLGCICVPIIIIICVVSCIFCGSSKNRRPATLLLTTAPNTVVSTSTSSKQTDYPTVAAHPSVPNNATDQHPAYPIQPPAPYPAQPQATYPAQPQATYPAQPPAGYPYPTQPPDSYPAQPQFPYPAQLHAPYPAQPPASFPAQDSSAFYPPQPLNENYSAPPQAAGYSEEPPPNSGYDGGACPSAPYPQ